MHSQPHPDEPQVHWAQEELLHTREAIFVANLRMRLERMPPFYPFRNPIQFAEMEGRTLSFSGGIYLL